MASVEPPTAARSFHDALYRNLQDLAAAQAEAQRRYGQATTVQQLDATNEALINTITLSGQRVQLAAGRLTPAILDALRGIASCGSLRFDS